MDAENRQVEHARFGCGHEVRQESNELVPECLDTHPGNLAESEVDSPVNPILRLEELHVWLGIVPEGPQCRISEEDGAADQRRIV